MIHKNDLKIGLRVIENIPDNPGEIPFRGTIQTIVDTGCGHCDYWVGIKIDDRFLDDPRIKANSIKGIAIAFARDFAILHEADEYGEDLLRHTIHENIRKNGGSWDLTDDEGNTIVYDRYRSIEIRDLALNGDNKPGVLVPLSYFNEEILRAILKTM